MMRWSKFILLLALLLNTSRLLADDKNGTAVAEAPPVEDAGVIISDDPAIIAEAQRRIVQEANRTGASVTRVILSGTAFDTLTPQELAPLTTEGESTDPSSAEELANAMDADRAGQIAKYARGSRMMAFSRAIAVGGLTSFTMVVAANRLNANEATQVASGLIGLAVGGPYSFFLQKIQQRNMDWQGTNSWLARDPVNRPAHPAVKIIKQMVVPVGLATLMATAKVAADQLPGVDFKTFWTNWRMLGPVGVMAVSSAAFQYPWQMLNAKLTKEDKANAGTDELALARQKFNTDKRALTLAMSLAVSNALALSGLPSLGTIASVASNLAGNRALAVKKRADEAARSLASNEDGSNAQAPRTFAAKVGGACTASYSALKAVAGRTLASVGVR